MIVASKNSNKSGVRYLNVSAVFSAMTSRGGTKTLKGTHENAKLFKRRFVPIWGLRGDQHLVRKYTCKYIFRYRVWPTNHSCRHAYAKHVYHQKKNYQTYRVLMSYIHTRTCGFERKIEIYTCSVCYASTGKTRKEPQGHHDIDCKLKLLNNFAFSLEYLKHACAAALIIISAAVIYKFKR